MTRQRVQLTKQKARRKTEPTSDGGQDQARAKGASRRARSITAAAARFLARTR